MSALSVHTMPTRLTWRTATLWAVLFALFIIPTIAAYDSAYPNFSDRLKLEVVLGANPAPKVLFGEAIDLQATGAFMAWRVGGFLAICVALWAALASTRLLRGEEETGRLETLRAGVYPHSRLIANVVLTLIAESIFIGLICFFASAVMIRNAISSAALFGASIAATSLVFVAIGTLTSQLVATRRGAAGLAGLLVGVSFTLRAVADLLDVKWILWLTPFGLFERTRVFVEDNWFPVVLLALGASAIFGLAFVLAKHRDYDVSVISHRRHSRSRLSFLSGPFAFGTRSIAGAMLAWFVGLTCFAFLIGSMAKAAIRTSNDSPEMQQALARIGKNFKGSGYFVGSIDGFFVLAFAICVVLTLARMQHEEQETRLDVLFSGVWSRSTWFVAQLGVLAVGVMLTSLCVAAAMFLGDTVANGSVSFVASVKGQLNLWPALVLLIGVFAYCYARAPMHVVPICMGFTVVSFLVSMLGGLLNWPSWLLNLSFFHHLRIVPAEAWGALSGIAMLVLGSALSGLGLLTFCRRDVSG